MNERPVPYVLGVAGPLLTLHRSDEDWRVLFDTLYEEDNG